MHVLCEVEAEAKEKAGHLLCLLWDTSWGWRNSRASTVLRQKLRPKKQFSIYCVFCETHAEAEETAEHRLCSSSGKHSICRALWGKSWGQRNSSASVFFVRHKLRLKKQLSIYCVLSEANSASTVFFVKRKLRLKKQPSIYRALCGAKAEAKETVQHLLCFLWETSWGSKKSWDLLCSLWGKKWGRKNISFYYILCEEAEETVEHRTHNTSHTDQING